MRPPSNVLDAPGDHTRRRCPACRHVTALTARSTLIGPREGRPVGGPCIAPGRGAGPSPRVNRETASPPGQGVVALGFEGHVPIRDRPSGCHARGRSVTIRQVAIESRSIAKTNQKPRSKRASGQPLLRLSDCTFRRRGAVLAQKERT